MDFVFTFKFEQAIYLYFKSVDLLEHTSCTLCWTPLRSPSRCLTKHKELLSSFLKAFLPISQEIQSVDILNIDSSIHPNIVEEKQIVLDLRLQLNTGERINVEMQSISKKDFLPRILFYWAKLYTGIL